jgi:hypothetical protein
LKDQLILPGDPLFGLTLAETLPPDWQRVSAALGEACVFVSEAGCGLLRPCNPAEAEDYLYGGEYEERIYEIGEFEDEDQECPGA